MLLSSFVLTLLVLHQTECFSTINFNMLKQSTLRLSSGPFKPIDQAYLRINKFGLSHVVAYKKTEDGSQRQCEDVCQGQQVCYVAVHCPNNPDRPKEMGRCHILEESQQSQAIPAESVTDYCSYLTVHPNCRKPPTVLNANPGPKFTFLEDGRIRYTFTCSPGFESKGDPISTCSKNGIWTQPSLLCNKKSIIFKSDTPETMKIKSRKGSNRINAPPPNSGFQLLKKTVLSTGNLNPFASVGDDNTDQTAKENHKNNNNDSDNDQGGIDVGDSLTDVGNALIDGGDALIDVGDAGDARDDRGNNDAVEVNNDRGIDVNDGSENNAENDDDDDNQSSKDGGGDVEDDDGDGDGDGDGDDGGGDEGGDDYGDDDNGGDAEYGSDNGGGEEVRDDYGDDDDDDGSDDGGGDGGGDEYGGDDDGGGDGGGDDYGSDDIWLLLHRVEFDRFFLLHRVEFDICLLLHLTTTPVNKL